MRSGTFDSELTADVIDSFCKKILTPDDHTIYFIFPAFCFCFFNNIIYIYFFELFVTFCYSINIPLHPLIASSPIRGCDGNNTNCFHVFKVSLSNLQGEDLNKSLKPVRKYGNNVFAPRGNSPRLTEKVMESMPVNADPRVKENIMNNNYYLKRVDADDGSLFPEDNNEILPQNIQHIHAAPPLVHREESFPIFVISLLIVVGILVGILGTCFVLILVDYKSKPKFDRSGVVTYKRPTELNKLYVERQRNGQLEKHGIRYAALHVQNSGNKANSSRKPRTHGRVSRYSCRENERLHAACRMADKQSRDRKISF
uniref:Syndecan n=1 Tax=Heterorhabditis bacteriophora TaxID=37862 RepID=A0A1I7WYB8_HETBA